MATFSITSTLTLIECSSGDIVQLPDVQTVDADFDCMILGSGEGEVTVRPHPKQKIAGVSGDYTLAAGTLLKLQGNTSDGWFIITGATVESSSGSGISGTTCGTSGTLSGVQVHVGDWETTGPITAQGLRLYVTGNVNILHDITVEPELEAAPRTPRIDGSDMRAGLNGAGLGGGQSQISKTTGGGAGSSGAGSFGGSGGLCGSALAGYTGYAGSTYTPDLQFCGSGGSAGWTTHFLNGTFGGAGGQGGGGIYIQGDNISVAAQIVANGTIGEMGDGVAGFQQGSGAGGSGGVIELRTPGDITLEATAVLQTIGGSGALGHYASTAGGGGGFITLMAGGSITTDEDAVIEPDGGGASVSGNGQVEASTDGSMGVFTEIEGRFVPRYF